MGSKIIVISDDDSGIKDQDLREQALHVIFSGPAKLSDFCAFKEQHFQIDRKSLISGSTINFSLFKQKGMEFSTLVNANKSTAVVDEELLKSIVGDTDCEILVKRADMPLYFEYLKSTFDSSGLTKDERLQRQAIIIKENSKKVMKELFDNPRSGEKIKELKAEVTNILEALLEKRDLIHTLLTLMQHDSYIYTHSVNVGVFSIGLGDFIGLKREKIENVGLGAMLHDIGMTAIPLEIWQKEGKLDEYQYKRLQEHVMEGEKIIQSNPEIPKEAHWAILQHHEKLSGEGYPNHLRGEDITIFGKITAIADCYDALTSSRPFREAYNAFEALKLIREEKVNYDLNLLTAFIKMLGKIR
jgi:HD-GYP domain-containing protein (c-di-GMP phosphodiesterase class II)